MGRGRGGRLYGDDADEDVLPNDWTTAHSGEPPYMTPSLSQDDFVHA